MAVQWRRGAVLGSGFRKSSKSTRIYHSIQSLCDDSAARWRRPEHARSAFARCCTDQVLRSVGARCIRVRDPGHTHCFAFRVLVWCARLRGGGRDARGLRPKRAGCKCGRTSCPGVRRYRISVVRPPASWYSRRAPLRPYFALRAVTIQGPRSTACIGIVGGARAGCGVAGVSRIAPEWACIRETGERGLYQHDNRQNPGGAILCAHGGSKRARCGYWEDCRGRPYGFRERTSARRAVVVHLPYAYVRLD